MMYKIPECILKEMPWYDNLPAFAYNNYKWNKTVKECIDVYTFEFDCVLSLEDEVYIYNSMELQALWLILYKFFQQVNFHHDSIITQPLREYLEEYSLARGGLLQVLP